MPISPSPSPRAPGARRAALLAHLRERESPMSVTEIASQTALHANTVRAHLEVLVREGAVARVTERSARRGRPRELYSAANPPEQAEPYAQLAAVLAAELERLGGRSPAIEAGKRWAGWESGTTATPRHADAIGSSSVTPAEPGSESTAVEGAARSEVLAVLERTGFAPELAADGAILLHHCPFVDVAREHTEVVCGAHLGLIQGTLDRVSPGARAQLVPFVDPHTCAARIEPA